VLGVGAGKGGVGKSTVAANLAIALAQTGARVGLLDADLYGPSVPIMLGLKGAKPAVNQNKKIVPAEAHGIKAISIGFLVQEDMAVAWRGPMVGQAVTQFVRDVEWGELDYLILDLPPGTGDIILTLGQTVPMTGALVVSTPQDVAFADVLRAVRMFSMLQVEVVGLVENMSYFRCPDNGKDYLIFGPSNSARHAAEHGLPFLGALPIELGVAPNADAGQPIVVAEPESHLTSLYHELAARIAATVDAKLAAQQAAPGLGEGFFSQAVTDYEPPTKH
jgi:ATP-binding protein involved in chromosome partitioning